MCLIILVYVFKDITVEFFLGADKGLYTSLESERKEGIFPCHVFVKLLYPLGLRGQEVVVFKQFNNLYQEIGMCKVDTVVR